MDMNQGRGGRGTAVEAVSEASWGAVGGGLGDG
jgi:hypothetical protein